MQYTVQAAARATGISAHRLRTWERRYGIPAPARSATGRRLYNEQDLSVIVRMARLIESGVPAPEAAQAALSGVDAPATIQPPGLNGAANEHVGALLKCAGALDPAGMRRVLEEALGQGSTAPAIEEVVLPFVRAMGDAWETGEVTMVYEHFATEMVRAALTGRLARLPSPPGDAPAILVACPAMERHDLGNVALWLLLAEAGLHVIYLGADVPTAELVMACRDRKPAAICLTATANTTLPTINHAVRALIEARVSARIFVGGPAFAGERDDRPVAGEHLPRSLVEAANYVVRELLEKAPA